MTSKIGAVCQIPEGRGLQGHLMKILYGTTNPGKLEAMRQTLAPLAQIEIIGLEQLTEELTKSILPEVEETGATPLENARIKALAYYAAFRIPVFSCDSGLYFDGLPEEVQPGIHVRNVHGKCLTDEEMTEYYRGLAERYGDITARYRNAICLVLDEEHIYESMEDSLSGEPFLLTSVPHPDHIRQKGFPLDCLSKDIATGRYYYDMEGHVQEEVTMYNGFRQFFQRILL